LKILSLASGSPSTSKLQSKAVFKGTKLSANDVAKQGGPMQFYKNNYFPWKISIAIKKPL
jgi:hypothetical protein